MLPGTTVRFRNRIYDFDDNLVKEVDSQEIKVYDPDDNLVTTLTSFTWDPVGLFYTTYTIPAGAKPGIWTIVWKVVAGGLDDKKKANFSVEKIP